MAKTGRPRKPIDWGAIDKLAAIFCTAEEIAGFLEVSDDTINKRCKENHGETFAEYIKKKQGIGKMSLRRRMWKAAQEGSIPMMIFLSKNVLGMRDKIEQKHQVEDDGMVDAVKILTDKIAAATPKKRGRTKTKAR